jgi:hypothetical protein
MPGHREFFPELVLELGEGRVRHGMAIVPCLKNCSSEHYRRAVMIRVRKLWKLWKLTTDWFPVTWIGFRWQRQEKVV